MQTRDMSDEQRLEMMLDYARVLLPISNWDWDRFSSYIHSERFRELGVFKAVELVGEAAYYMTEGAEQRYPGIDFKEMKWLRHSIVHSYAVVTPRSVYAFIRESVPDLVQKLQSYSD